MANVSDLRNQAIEKYNACVDLAVGQMVNDLRLSAPYATGQTSREIYSQPTSSSTESISYNIAAPTPQGEFVEDGTSPHIIVPVNAKALHFFIQGDEVFAKKVHHPGMPARPWFRPILEQWSDYLSAALNS